MAESGNDRLARAAEVFRIEARAIEQLETLLDESFHRAVDLVLGCEGMVVVSGMGKAGLVGAKTSATLASTGTPSISLHPAEALHGDLGRVRRQDVLIAISNSGETAEIKALLPPVKRIGASLIAVTGDASSTLARESDCVLDIGRTDEACPLGLAPTASTAAMMAMLDALAMVVQAERGFSRQEFARYHPAGALGRQLLRVDEIMRKGEQVPITPSGTALSAAIVTMSNTPGRPGATLVVDPGGRLLGIFSDGDLRRVFEGAGGVQLDDPVDEHMTRDPKLAHPGELVEQAAGVLRRHKIDQLPVVDDDGRPVGLLDIQDVLDVRL